MWIKDTEKIYPLKALTICLQLLLGFFFLLILLTSEAFYIPFPAFLLFLLSKSNKLDQVEANILMLTLIF